MNPDDLVVLGLIQITNDLVSAVWSAPKWMVCTPRQVAVWQAQSADAYLYFVCDPYGHDDFKDHTYSLRTGEIV